MIYQKKPKSDISVYPNGVRRFIEASITNDKVRVFDSNPHIPTNKILVIQKSEDKEIIIEALSISDADVSLYIPNTVVSIVANEPSFYNAKIYYEGSKEEWKNLFANDQDYNWFMHDNPNITYNTSYEGWE